MAGRAPAAANEVVSVAMPLLLSWTVSNVVEPSTNVTLPVGVPSVVVVVLLRLIKMWLQASNSAVGIPAPPHQTSCQAFPGHAAQTQEKVRHWPARSCGVVYGFLAGRPFLDRRIIARLEVGPHYCSQTTRKPSCGPQVMGSWWLRYATP